MKPTFLLGISWLAVLLTAPLALQAQSPAVQAQAVKPAAQAHTYTLANGMTLWVKPDRRAPTAVHMVWVRVGSMDEVDGTSGVAHVLEHMLFKGTNTLAAGEFSRRVAALAGAGAVAPAGHIADNPRIRAAAAARRTPARRGFTGSGVPWGCWIRSDMVHKFARGNG